MIGLLGLGGIIAGGVMAVYGLVTWQPMLMGYGICTVLGALSFLTLGE